MRVRASLGLGTVPRGRLGTAVLNVYDIGRWLWRVRAGPVVRGRTHGMAWDISFGDNKNRPMLPWRKSSCPRVGCAGTELPWTVVRISIDEVMFPVAVTAIFYIEIDGHACISSTGPGKHLLPRRDSKSG